VRPELRSRATSSESSISARRTAWGKSLIANERRVQRNTTFTHAHETLLRTSKGKGACHTFNLELVRRALLASTGEEDLVFDPFSDSGTTAVAATEPNRAFVGAELKGEFAGGLATRRVAANGRGSLLCEISEQVWVGA
jgi:hypothetical protein